jgi:glycosyltransferase involved in cell wall biosynthesis
VRHASSNSPSASPRENTLEVAVIVPAYDESATIAAVVAGIRRYVPDVFVVDDGSTDDTGANAAAAGAVVLRHDTNRGKGAAIRTGVAHVLRLDYTHVLCMDADMQHAPDDIPKLLDRARTGAGDFVIGERVFDKATMPRSRYYSNTIGSRALSWFIGAPVRDTQSGFRLIRTSLLKGVSLEARGYEIETEMLIKLARRGARIEGVPVALRYHGARSKLRPVRDTTRTCFLAVYYRFLQRS